MNQKNNFKYLLILLLLSLASLLEPQSAIAQKHKDARSIPRWQIGFKKDRFQAQKNF